MCIPGLCADKKQGLLSYATTCDSETECLTSVVGPQKISGHLHVSFSVCKMEIEYLVILA